jgi:hypothetical protein
VVVCSDDFDCGPSASVAGSDAPPTLIRQDTSTGALSRLSTFCTEGDGGTDAGPILAGCYQDECVAPGSYHYGLETPFSCSVHGCSQAIPYYAAATVTATLPASCTLSAGNTGAVAYDGALPWPSSGDGELACSGCSCSTGTTSVLGLDGGLLVLSLLLLRRARRIRR